MNEEFSNHVRGATAKNQMNATRDPPPLPDSSGAERNSLEKLDPTLPTNLARMTSSTRSISSIENDVLYDSVRTSARGALSRLWGMNNFVTSSSGGDDIRAESPSSTGERESESERE